MKRIKDAKNPLIANGDRRATLLSMSTMLAAILATVVGPLFARAADGGPAGHVDRRRFVADFSQRFRTEFETEAMKRPVGDFRPGRAPVWMHQWMDILWDRLIKAHFPGPTTPR